MSNQSSPHAVLDALGDSTRRQILEALRAGPKPVGSLADQLPVGRPAVSKHLKILQGVGLVTHRSVGTSNLYALDPDGPRVVQQWLLDQWGAALDAFASHVERTRR
jgi:DNA-binding transcriptional ArsR family regulator